MPRFIYVLALILIVSSCGPEPEDQPHEDADLGDTIHDFWIPVDPVAELEIEKTEEDSERLPASYLAFILDVDALGAYLKEAEAVNRNPELTLPLPDSSWVTFQLEDSGVMSEELQQRYPEIRSYRGRTNGKTASVDFNRNGLHVMISGLADPVIIGEYLVGEYRLYLSYNRSEFPADPPDRSSPLPPPEEES